MDEGANLVEERLRNALVVEEGGLACLQRLVAFFFRWAAMERGADLGESGINVGRGVIEGGAGVSDGDANELDASPISL